MAEFIAIRPKIYSYLTHDKNEKKIAKYTKKCVVKKNFSLNLKIINFV